MKVDAVVADPADAAGPVPRMVGGRRLLHRPDHVVRTRLLRARRLPQRVQQRAGLAAQDDLAGDHHLLHRRWCGRRRRRPTDRPLRRSLRDRRRRTHRRACRWRCSARSRSSGSCSSSTACSASAFAAAGLVPATTVVTRWFHERRSVALSVASTGLSVGGILITPFAKRLIDDRGLAAATPWLGLVFVIGHRAVRLVHGAPRPGREGWNPDGKRIVVGDAPAAADRHLLRAGGPDEVLRRRDRRLHLRPRFAGRRHPAARRSSSRIAPTRAPRSSPSPCSRRRRSSRGSSAAGWCSSCR